MLAINAASASNNSTLVLVVCVAFCVPSIPLNTWIVSVLAEPVTFIISSSILITGVSSKLALLATVRFVWLASIPPFNVVATLMEPLISWCPYDLDTCKNPEKSVSDDSSVLELLITNMNSFENPVPDIFFANIISSFTNPLTLSTNNDVSDIAAELDSAVEFPTYNIPPTAFTVSFSNVVVLNVPRILMFSNSAVPFPNEDILQPARNGSKSRVRISPDESIIKLLLLIVLLPISNPPITPALALICPWLFTVNPLDDITRLDFDCPAPVAEPLNINVGVFLSPVKNASSSVVNPPIKPADAVILPSNVAPLAIKIPSLSTMKFGPILI